MTVSEEVEKMVRAYISKNPSCVVLGFGHESNVGRNIYGYIIEVNPRGYAYDWEQTFTGDISTFLYIAIPTEHNLKGINNKTFLLPEQLMDLGLKRTTLSQRTIQL